VDDHGVVRGGLKALVESEANVTVVGEAADGAAAVTEAERLRPDVVVMDVALPVLNGAEASRHIKAALPDTKILMLSAHEERAYVKLCLDAGATGYILKRAAARDLARAISVVANGGVYLDPAIAAQLVPPARRRSRSGEFVAHVELSERELEVLRHIARGLSVRDIAERLAVSTRSVETYRARAMEKLALKNRAEVVTYALHRGWLDCA
jgi:DNA-binding NarL/FixJ family response regulator